MKQQRVWFALSSSLSCLRIGQAAFHFYPDRLSRVSNGLAQRSRGRRRRFTFSTTRYHGVGAYFSICSQWIPIPPPMNFHSFLCFSVAFNNRGNHANGTDTDRPSSSTTVKASLEVYPINRSGMLQQSFQDRSSGQASNSIGCAPFVDSNCRRR